jgi:hypothetical protein
MVAEKVEAGRLVFVDEMGTNTSLSSLYAWAPKGERAHCCSVPRNHGPNTTLLASMSSKGMGSCLAVVGGTTTAVFEAYDVEKVLVPSLRIGQIVVMDNLCAHKGERVKELIEEPGCELLHLPPYSPGFNPIEESLLKCQAADRVSNMVTLRSIAHITLTLRCASAMRAWVCRLPSALFRS